MTAPAKPVACFLHLSDLHLGRSFADVGGKDRNVTRAYVDGGRLRMQSHDSMMLIGLASELMLLRAKVQQRFAVAWGSTLSRPDAFDRVIVSGDISTEATDESRFTFAFEYLTGRVPISSDRVYSHQSHVGLSLDPRRLLCVPGNHDKLHEPTLKRYNSAFSNTPTACNYVTFVRCVGQVVVFVGMDSNEYADGTIARGEIDDERFAWLSRTLTELEVAGLTVGDDRLTADECKSATRCLVLHHHVASLDAGRDLLARLKQPFVRHTTVLKGADKLLDLIRDRIDIVFHGHEHLPLCFRETRSGALVISAGTTSEWTRKPFHNSFYVVTLLEDRTVEVEEYQWNGTAFKPKGRNGAALRQRFPLRAVEDDESAALRA